MWTRRDVLSLGLLTGASWSLSTGLPRRTLAQPAAPRTTPRARYTCIILLSGGIDPVYTLDPKLRDEVEAEVDLPYAPEAIVSSGEVKLGPHFAPLVRHAGKMAIVRGVALNTANHNTGLMQLLRLKTDVHAQMPSLLELIGSRRSGQPLACITLGMFLHELYSGGFFGTGPKRDAAADPEARDLFGRLDELAPADLERMAHVLRAQATRLREAGGSPERLVAAANLEQSAALFALLPRARPFVSEVWTPDRLGQGFAESFQRVLWALENDLTSGVMLTLGGLGWDSHFENAKRQARYNSQLAPQLARFLDQLETRRNAHGSLAEQTQLVVGSEIGRFPRLNDLQGKDHFPEAPYLFIGPGIRSGDGRGAVYGTTGRQLEAAPISLRTGRAVAAGGHPVSLDDLGATLLHAAGLEPAAFGYFGKRLEFLVEV